MFLGPSHGKYLLVRTEESSELVPGNKLEEVDTGPLEEDKYDGDLSLINSLPDVMDSRGPFHQASSNKRGNAVDQGIINTANWGLPCVFRCHGNVTTIQF